MERGKRIRESIGGLRMTKVIVYMYGNVIMKPLTMNN
jgi:hypothetical protein